MTVCKTFHENNYKALSITLRFGKRPILPHCGKKSVFLYRLGFRHDNIDFDNIKY